MKTRQISLIYLYLFIGISIGACLSACSHPPAHSNQNYTFKQVVSLQQINIEDQKIKFNVISTGCTQENDFIIKRKKTDQQCEIIIYRIKPDLCKRAPQLMSVSLSWDKSLQCDNLPVNVSNPQPTKPPDTF